jgi:hypothetical protein
MGSSDGVTRLSDRKKFDTSKACQDVDAFSDMHEQSLSFSLRAAEKAAAEGTEIEDAVSG